MPAKQSDILLCTINASYIHASLGLRYLYANLDDLQNSCSISEFTCHLRPVDIVEKILHKRPKIVGFGVYIWNVEHTTRVVQLLKNIAPEVIIIIGGPEVSYEYEKQPIFLSADYLIRGAADRGFAALCRQLLNNQIVQQSVFFNNKVFEFKEPPLQEITLPYSCYSEEDINFRVIYVEASRGCPFKCEFCLSALDKTSMPFDIDRFLTEMENLYCRGARNFKFVDRTFNLKTETSLKILNFFLQRMDERLFLHFEIIPDRLPELLKETLMKFPKGSLQFEIGVQTFNPQVQSLISRKQDNHKTIENMIWLKKNSQAHIHADLIFGLPGEDLDSFGKGFNQLYELRPHEIQLGILKRLRGTPVIRHSEAYQLRFDSSAPYSILSTDRVSFIELQRVSRFARYWELIVNSGNFQRSLTLLLNEQAFQRFLIFSDWLYSFSGKTHQIALRKLYDYLFFAYKHCFTSGPAIKIDEQEYVNALLEDYKESGLKGAPEFYKTMS